MEQNKSQKKSLQTIPPFEGPYSKKPSALPGKHGIGFSTARHLARLGMKKITKEEVDGCPVCGQDSCSCNHVQEVSSELLDRYKTGAKKSADELAAKGNYKKSNDRLLNVMKATGKQIDKTTANIRKALNREEVEQVDEVEWKPFNAKGSNPVQKGPTHPVPKARPGYEAALKAHIAASVKRKAEDEKQGRDSASGKSYNEEVKMSDYTFLKLRADLVEKTLTPAEKKKREEVAKAIERDNPDMPMGMKMAIATKTAKRVAEDVELDEAKSLASMSMAELKAKHAEVSKKIDDAGRSKMISMNHPLSQQKRAIKLHMMIKQQKAAKGMSEDVEQLEDQHYCAKHVRSDILGDGVVLEAQHAEPDADGQIEWYMVEFKDGVHKVYTEDLEIMIAEFHGNHKKKKR